MKNTNNTDNPNFTIPKSYYDGAIAIAKAANKTTKDIFKQTCFTTYEYNKDVIHNNTGLKHVLAEIEKARLEKRGINELRVGMYGKILSPWLEFTGIWEPGNITMCCDT